MTIIALRRRLLTAPSIVIPGGGPSDWRGRIPYGSAAAPYGGSFIGGWWFPPAYPSEPTPTGSGTRRTAANTTELNAIIASLVPGDVIVLTGTSYEGVNWAGGSGEVGGSRELGSSQSGTDTDRIVFYSASQYSAVMTKTSGLSVLLATVSTNSYMEWWGIDWQAGSGRSVAEIWEGTGLYMKWCRMRNNRQGPCVRYAGTTEFGNYFNDGENASATSQAEMFYEGWGSDTSAYRQEGGRDIGNIVTRSAGGTFDIKSNVTDYLNDYSVIDADDFTSGGVQLNAGLDQLTTTQFNLSSVDDVVLRNGIIKCQRAPGVTSDGDAIRGGGFFTVENTALFAGAGTVEDAIFVYQPRPSVSVDVRVDSCRMHGFNRAYSSGTGGNGGTFNITGGDNRSDTSLNGLSGSIVADGVYDGPLTGDYSDGDTSAPLDGLGRGLAMVGAATPYDVV